MDTTHDSGKLITIKLTKMKKIMIAVAALLIVIQIFRPERNSSTSPGKEFEKQLAVPMNISKMLKTSCYDCHSNNTNYPWYSNIQPIAWWLKDHIDDGKKHLNFDEFENYTPEKKRDTISEIIETMEKGEMPLRSYTLIHSDAKLTVNQQQQLIKWARSLKAGWESERN